MDEIDREALVASTQKPSSLPFWLCVAALPVLGVLAGWALGFGGAGKPAEIFSADASTGPIAQPPVQQKASLRPASAPPRQQSGANPSGMPAREQLHRYRMAISTLNKCAGNGPADHYRTAMKTYQDRNMAKYSVVQQKASAELEAGLTIPDTQLGVFVAGATGQLQRDTFKYMDEVSRMLDEQEAGFLGANPDNIGCTKFRSDVMIGKYDLKLR